MHAFVNVYLIFAATFSCSGASAGLHYATDCNHGVLQWDTAASRAIQGERFLDCFLQIAQVLQDVKSRLYKRLPETSHESKHMPQPCCVTRCHPGAWLT